MARDLLLVSEWFQPPDRFVSSKAVSEPLRPPLSRRVLYGSVCPKESSFLFVRIVSSFVYFFFLQLLLLSVRVRGRHKSDIPAEAGPKWALHFECGVSSSSSSRFSFYFSLRRTLTWNRGEEGHTLWRRRAVIIDASKKLTDRGVEISFFLRRPSTRWGYFSVKCECTFLFF